MSLFRFTRTSQPKQPVPIDWSNPITRGLVSAPVPALGIDAVSGKTLTAAGAATTIAPGLSGMKLLGTGSSVRYADITPIVMTEWTAFVHMDGTTTLTDRFYCGVGNASANAPLMGVIAGNADGSKIRNWARTDAGPNTSAAVSTTRGVTDGKPHSAATTCTQTAISSYVDGVFDTTTAQVTGTYTATKFAVCGNWRSGAIAAPTGNNVYVALLFNRALSDAEIKSLSGNPWQIFQPTNRAIYPETDASPDITLALTGEDVVAAQGSAAPVITVPLTGVATAVAQGTLTVAGNSDITLPLTGLATVADQGSLLASASIPLTGQATVAARGTLSPETSKELTGQAVALAQGNVSPQASVALTGQAVVAAQGVLVAPGDVTVALTGQGVSLATGLMVGSVTPDPGNGKSGVNRMWLIEYYTKEFAKKEATQVVALEGLTATAKRKAVKKAAVEREAAVEKLVAKAESDLEVLTQGIADIGAAQRFTQALIRQAARRPEPETDFMQVANDYRKRMQQEDDELLLFAMVI